MLAVLRLSDVPMVAALARQGGTLDKATAAVAAVRGLPERGRRCASCRKPMRIDFDLKIEQVLLGRSPIELDPNRVVARFRR